MCARRTPPSGAGYTQEREAFMTLNMTIGRTDWAALAQQKLALLNTIDREEDYATREHLEGILNWIDAIQDAAKVEGFPVVFLEDSE